MIIKEGFRKRLTEIIDSKEETGEKVDKILRDTCMLNLTSVIFKLTPVDFEKTDQAISKIAAAIDEAKLTNVDVLYILLVFSQLLSVSGWNVEIVTTPGEQDAQTKN